jgi:hypothetical protein
MSMMNFDPTAYLEMSVDAPMEKRPPAPAGVYFPANITGLNVAQWRSKEKIDEATGALKEGIHFDIALEVQFPTDLKQQYGLTFDKLTITDGVMIDRNSAGGIDTTPGKNTGLRKYREACDLNLPDEVFKPVQLVGRTVMVKFKHEEYPAGSGNLQERIADVIRP